ncbi:hypothetical protein AB0F81_10590 [Actinoplanes sp. NPDC024001]|uniref:hypothetical protein n=1 Tax=Actinoplanes sp. NPDC024001 TaxID=3154598 RepID=UPI0033E394FF
MSQQVRSRPIRRAPVQQPGFRPSRRLVIGAGAGAALVVAGVVTWALWPEPPRQREYLDATACLLTDEKGIAADPAKPVWTAMQDASVTSLVKVQHLQVDGPQTAENATTYLASLANSRCNVVIAVGEAQIASVAKNAATYPGVQFLTVGGGSAAANVQVIDSSAGALKPALEDRLDALADDAS